MTADVLHQAVPVELCIASFSQKMVRFMIFNIFNGCAPVWLYVSCVLYSLY